MAAQRYVYFLQHGDDGKGPIKIGKSSNPWARVCELQTGNPFPLRILAVVHGWTYEEHELHRRFAHLRRSPNPPRRAGGWIRQDGIGRVGEEWLNAGPDLLDYIASLRGGRDAVG